jgi:hypothetical protein
MINIPMHPNDRRTISLSMRRASHGRRCTSLRRRHESRKGDPRTCTESWDLRTELAAPRSPFVTLQRPAPMACRPSGHPAHYRCPLINSASTAESPVGDSYRVGAPAASNARTVPG